MTNRIGEGLKASEILEAIGYCWVDRNKTSINIQDDKINFHPDKIQ